MKTKVKVAISMRHIHLTKESYKKLFGTEEMTKRNDISQIGEYAANQTVTIKTTKSEIEHVRIVGPCRNYDQVEISVTDSYQLGLQPPVRYSGDVKNSPGIIIVGPFGEIELPEGVIINQRHLHINEQDALKLGIENNQKLQAIVNSQKGGVMDIFVKVKSNGVFELHLDSDDANSFLLKNNDEVEITDEI